MTMIVAVVLTLLAPTAARLPWDTAAKVVPALVATLAFVLFAGGLLVWLFSRGRYGRYVQRAEAARDLLAAGGADLKQAVSLLFHAYCSDGPSLSQTLKVEETRQKLGAALPYVIEVEEALKAELKIYALFTSGTEDKSPATPPATPKA